MKNEKIRETIFSCYIYIKVLNNKDLKNSLYYTHLIELLLLSGTHIFTYTCTYLFI